MPDARGNGPGPCVNARATSPSAQPARVAARLPHLSKHDVVEIDAEVRAALREIETGLPESTIALCLNHSDGKRKSVTRGFIKPSPAVLRARELAKLELKRAAFNQWADRLRGIVG